MYFTMVNKHGREIRTYSRIKAFYLWVLGWKLVHRFEGSE